MRKLWKSVALSFTFWFLHFVFFCFFFSGRMKNDEIIKLGREKLSLASELVFG